MSFFNQDHKQGNGASGPDFAALVERAKSQPGAMEPMNALWGAVYQLPYWRFVARGEFPGVYPSVCFIDGQHWVMAFTDESALRAFVATQSGQVESDASQMLLEIERVGGMLSWLQTKGVHHIMFNYGLHAFHAPLVNIPAMYEHFNGRKLPDAAGTEFLKHLDEALAAAGDSPPPQSPPAAEAEQEMPVEPERTAAIPPGETEAEPARSAQLIELEQQRRMGMHDEGRRPASIEQAEARQRLSGLWVYRWQHSDYATFHHVKLDGDGNAQFRICGRDGTVENEYKDEPRCTWELSDDGHDVRVTLEHPESWVPDRYGDEYYPAETLTREFALFWSDDGKLQMLERNKPISEQLPLYTRIEPQQQQA